MSGKGEDRASYLVVMYTMVVTACDGVDKLNVAEDRWLARCPPNTDLIRTMGGTRNPTLDPSRKTRDHLPHQGMYSHIS